MTTTTAAVRPSLPTGTWQLDPVHSSIGFEVEYMSGTFRGHFHDVDATLVVDGAAAALAGSARVASADVKDDALAAHLQSPEFFDAERHPELRFASSDIVVTEGGLTIHGDITIKGVTEAVALEGAITGPITDPYGRERIGIQVAATIDRTKFGIDWNAPLPTGKPALANEVAVVAELYFTKEA
jgi:polyisoprenoid-binding protein YceI